MASPSQDSIPHLTPTERLEPEDWERMREEISALYDSYPLKDVVILMKTCYNFDATLRAYKEHLKGWGKFKNVKSHEIQHEHAKRGGDINCDHIVRGVKVSKKKVVRHLKRMQQPKMSKATTLGHSRSIRTAASAARPADFRVLSPPTAPRSLTAPDLFRHSEQTYHLVDAFVRGSLDRITGPVLSSEAFFAQIVHEPTELSVTDLLSCLERETSNACRFYRGHRSKGHYCSAHYLSIAMAGLQELARFSSPYLLWDIPFLILNTSLVWQLPDLSQMILRCLADSAESYYGRNYPMHLIWRQLSRMEKADVADTLITVTEIVSNVFSAVLGTSHEDTISAFQSHIGCVELGMSLQSAANRLQVKVNDLARTLPEDDHRVLGARAQSAQLHMFGHNFVDGKTEAGLLIRWVPEDIEAEYRKARYLARALSIAATCNFELRRLDQAISQKRKCISLLQKLGTRCSRELVENVSELTHWLQIDDDQLTEEFEEEALGFGYIAGFWEMIERDAIVEAVGGWERVTDS